LTFSVAASAAATDLAAEIRGVFELPNSLAAQRRLRGPLMPAQMDARTDDARTANAAGNRSGGG